MKSIKSILLVLTAALILHSAIAPNMARADEIIANNSSTASCSNTNTTCYTTIQAAIDAASAATGTTYSVRVEPGTYQENLTLKGITVRGRETARTILYGSGSGTLVTANAGSTSSIYNLTFANAAVGIAASASAGLTIKNNVFWGITTAVTIQAAPSTSITNNVFYNNGTAISADAADNTITNNIFLSNTSSIALNLSNTFMTYNDFFDNADGLTWSGNNNISSDPAFVDTTSADFHLQLGSPCISTGSGGVDMGAYGGTDADSIPFMVSGVTGTQDATTSTTITVSWNANNSYLVTGYRVYYGTTSGVYTGTDAAEGASPITVTTTSETLSNLTSTATVPDTPTLDPPVVMSESLGLSWSAVTGATGYIIWGDIDDGTSSPPTIIYKEVGSEETSYTLTGLTNGVKYKVAVSAVSQPTYYIAVTAVNSTTSGTSTPGIADESAYSSEVSVPMGNTLEGALSNVEIEFPEALVAYPALTSQGQRCFIATAAFGYYSAPEVQALREFRDQYLLTNSAGSAFVRWYYEHGPVAAAYLDAHPAYKPVVRAALMPAVGAALFMTKTPFFIRTVVALFILMIALMIAYRSFRKKLSGSGGAL